MPEPRGSGWSRPGPTASQESAGGHRTRLPFPLVDRSARHAQPHGGECLLPRLRVEGHGVDQHAVQIKADGGQWRSGGSWVSGTENMALCDVHVVY